MHTISVPQTTNSGRKVVHLVQWTTQKITIDTCFQGSSCVVREGVVQLGDNISDGSKKV
jgi:hypothetical protein